MPSNEDMREGREALRAANAQAHRDGIAAYKSGKDVTGKPSNALMTWEGGWRTAARADNQSECVIQYGHLHTCGVCTLAKANGI